MLRSPRRNAGPIVKTNRQIRANQIRLIGAGGEQLGIVSLDEGIKNAQDAGLDLVEVSSGTEPPVCKVLDAGKYIYSLGKKKRESKKKQKVVDVKEIKMTSKIEEHDYQTKLRNARRFLGRGDKVKLRVFFRGREITHSGRGVELVKRFCDDLSDISEIERNDGLQGNAIHVFLMPLKSVRKKPKNQDAKATAEKKEAEKPKVEQTDSE